LLFRFLIKVGEDNETVAVWGRNRERFHDSGFNDGGEVKSVVFDDVNFVWTSDDKVVGVWIPREIGGLERVGLVFEFLN